MIPILIGTGLYLSLRLGFFQIRNIRKILATVFRQAFSEKNGEKKNGLSSWETLSTALASTIGTGSIVGIAVAVKLGGPGAVFWMWVSAFLGMATKYVEVVLAVKYRQKESTGFFTGGPMYYLRYGLGAKKLAAVFAALCLAVTFGMGNSVQANAISNALFRRFHWNEVYVGVVLAFLVGCVVLGGAKRIASINAALVPFMSALYILACFLIIMMRIQSMPRIFSKIVQEAFSFPAAFGGVSSFGLSVAMKNGFAKGMFSNEAGLGSAPIAHASAESDDATEHGYFAVFEVFFTTLIICTLTALVVLSTDPQLLLHLEGSQIPPAVFEDALPNFGGLCVCICTVLFSLSTILGWSFYGEICLKYLFPNGKIIFKLYRILYVLAVYFGVVGSFDRIWTLSELFNGLMALPNLIGIMLLSKYVEHKEK